ncbi:MAG TPA: hypothetical protein VFU81_11260, partial [Thermomicrobiales bacterium]|nr:hypothetical protein [Thermomicrobiales bacterium]
PTDGASFGVRLTMSTGSVTPIDFTIGARPSDPGFGIEQSDVTNLSEEHVLGASAFVYFVRLVNENEDDIVFRD